MSKEEKREARTIKVPPHRHCKVCGKMIPPDAEYCSTKCEKIDLDRRKSYETYKTWLFITLAMIMVLAIVNIVLIGLGR
ncbi:MAG: DUF2116 family Zn-ribbon domain-containing protein [Thermoprotei archaeon]|nr:DUF2116 family Zn-ribbon domain-containing protein [Thermoprotei archaeon]